jgi:hypothetical protein
MLSNKLSKKLFLKLVVELRTHVVVDHMEMDRDEHGLR